MGQDKNVVAPKIIGDLVRRHFVHFFYRPGRDLDPDDVVEVEIPPEDAGDTSKLTFPSGNGLPYEYSFHSHLSVTVDEDGTPIKLVGGKRSSKRYRVGRIYTPEQAAAKDPQFQVYAQDRDVAQFLRTPNGHWVAIRGPDARIHDVGDDPRIPLPKTR